mmetsp:Transcript_129483/g.360695  ORF Transcript_129483/g.360695 Transcript_129483/m.360695 type:complete len:274 (-) Transcript_129483:220-1041(-)
MSQRPAVAMSLLKSEATASAPTSHSASGEMSSTLATSSSGTPRFLRICIFACRSSPCPSLDSSILGGRYAIVSWGSMGWQLNSSSSVQRTWTLKDVLVLPARRTDWALWTPTKTTAKEWAGGGEGSLFKGFQAARSQRRPFLPVSSPASLWSSNGLCLTAHLIISFTRNARLPRKSSDLKASSSQSVMDTDCTWASDTINGTLYSKIGHKVLQTVGDVNLIAPKHTSRYGSEDAAAEMYQSAAGRSSAFQMSSHKIPSRPGWVMSKTSAFGFS